MRSGRGVLCPKRTVKGSYGVTIKRLREMGLFEPPGFLALSWRFTSGRTAGASVFRVAHDGGSEVVRFLYTVTDRSTGESKKVSSDASLARTPCRFGGFRRWFVCPGCGSRRTALYIGGSEGARCRECRSLTYISRQRHRDPFHDLWHRPKERLAALEAKRARVRSPERREELDRQWLRETRKLEVFNAAMARVPVRLRRSTRLGRGGEQ